MRLWLFLQKNVKWNEVLHGNIKRQTSEFIKGCFTIFLERNFKMA